MAEYQRSQKYREMVADLYEQRAERYNGEFSRNWSTASEFRSAVQRFCDASIPQDYTGRTLDIGAGTGRTLLGISDRLPQVIALDLSLPMLRKIKPRGMSIQRICADAHRIPLRSNSIQGVFLMSVLQYVDVDSLLTELTRVVCERAWVCVGSICVHESDKARWRDEAFQALSPPQIRRFYSEREIVAAFGRHGFILSDSVVVPFRRRFTEYTRDHELDKYSAPLKDGLNLFSDAPPEIKEIYDIADDGFTQFYHLLRFAT